MPTYLSKLIGNRWHSKDFISGGSFITNALVMKDPPNHIEYRHSCGATNISEECLIIRPNIQRKVMCFSFAQTNGIED